MTAERHAQQAGEDAKEQRAGDGERASGRRDEAGRRDHPESLRPFAGDERAIAAAFAVEAIPGAEFELAAEFPGLGGTRPMSIILKAEIDDKARPDRHCGDEKHELTACRRIGDRDPRAAYRIGDDERRKNQKWRNVEKSADRAFEGIMADEAAIAVKGTGGVEIDLRP